MPPDRSSCTDSQPISDARLYREPRHIWLRTTVDVVRYMVIIHPVTDNLTTTLNKTGRQHEHKQATPSDQ